MKSIDLALMRRRRRGVVLAVLLAAAVALTCAAAAAGVWNGLALLALLVWGLFLAASAAGPTREDA